MTCSDEPASVPTGPDAASATSSSNNTAIARRESRTVAPGDGGSPWRAPASCRGQSNVTPQSRGRRSLWPGSQGNTLFHARMQQSRQIFGDRTLDEISNSRLFRLKQRTLPWRFQIVHRPGKANSAADAASRYPSYSTRLTCPTLWNQHYWPPSATTPRSLAPFYGHSSPAKQQRIPPWATSSS